MCQQNYVTARQEKYSYQMDRFINECYDHCHHKSCVFCKIGITKLSLNKNSSVLSVDRVLNTQQRISVSVSFSGF